jgi:thiamine pyrophosphokinase
MLLPDRLQNKNEWLFVGPMGPKIPDNLSHLPRICVDGGARYADTMDIWIGDADSYKEKAHANDIFKLPVDKDQSDLAVSLDLFKDPRHYKFHFWGFLGGRKDHELFNLGESLHFLEQHQECQILFYNEHSHLTFMLAGAGIWKFTHQGVFSLGTLKKTDVKLTGNVKFPIPKTHPLYPLSSLGLSNVGEGEFQLENHGPVFLYFPEEP